MEETLDLIGLVKAHPWSADPVGKDDFDYDHDWRGAEAAAVEVLRALADKDVGFAGRDDEVWTLLDAETRDREEPSGIISGARDPLDSAINRRCTRALEAVLSFMAHEFRSTAKFGCIRSPGGRTSPRGVGRRRASSDHRDANRIPPTHRIRMG